MKAFINEINELQRLSYKPDVDWYFLKNDELKEIDDSYAISIFIKPFEKTPIYVEDRFLEIVFQVPKNWPINALQFFFASNVQHPNIDNKETQNWGYRMCHEVTSRHNTNFSLYAVLTSIRHCLSDPFPTSALNQKAAKLYMENPETFFSEFKQYLQSSGTTEDDIYRLKADIHFEKETEEVEGIEENKTTSSACGKRKPVASNSSGQKKRIIDLCDD